MKKWFEKMGIKKADEMERSIQLKSIRFAYLYTVLFLVAWSFYESFRVYQTHQRLNLLPCFLLVTQNLILIISQQIYAKKMVEGDEEEQPASTGKWIFMVLLIAAAIAVIGSVVNLFLL